MYDYMSLHLPDFPPPPPDSGRSIVWAGGSNAAANTWDIGSTSSFRLNATPTAFGTGDAVAFNDNGSNATSITLAGTLEPNSVTVSGTKNYNITGSGALSGAMSLVKSGTSTLTLSQANSYFGTTEINGGVISLANDTANANGLGTSDVILRNGTLRMFSNGADTSNVASFWNLDIPGGFTGTLESDWRCQLRGKLSGSGTFRYRLPSGAVRSSIFGDWSAFSGTIEASAISGSADFSIAPDYAWVGIPSAALNLGAGVTALWAGNLNSGSSSFVSIGQLSGAATSFLRGGNILGRQLTYRIGARGGDATFAGTISEQTNGITNLVKQGTGSWNLTGSAAINGNLTVEDGTLAISGTFNQITGKSASVLEEASLTLNGTLNTPSLTIVGGGLLTGSGTLNGNLSNAGMVELTGGHFTVSGDITNSGYFRVKSPATFSLTGAFTNSGVLNLIGSSQPIPAGIANTGVILMDRAPTTITWTGSYSNRWDLQQSINWSESPSQLAVFFPGDDVVFDDSAAETTVAIDGNLAPASVTVATNNGYVISGGTLSGSGSLMKSGSGSLTIASELGINGTVSVSGGSLVLTDAASWPALSPLIDISSGAVLNISAVAGGTTLGPAQTLRGAGTVQGDLLIQGRHDPAGSFTENGSLQYAAGSRLSWALVANSNTSGTFDFVQASAASFVTGSTLDLVFNSPGSSVSFNDAYWASPRSWTILTAGTLSGIPTVGQVSADPGGVAPLAIGNFTVSLSGSNLMLNWIPEAVVARWRGNANANWDLSSHNWDRNGAISIFQNGLATLIDDGTEVTSITLTGNLVPHAIEFDSVKDYTLSGSGSLSGAATLDKKGSGRLTISTANDFTGGTTIRSGSLTIAHASALGTGTVTLAGGRLDTATLTPTNAIVVNADSTMGGGASNGIHGVKAISGSGVLTLDATNVFDLEGSMSGFSGTVMLTGSGSFRFNGSIGSAAAAFQLGTRTLGIRNAGNYQIGSLTGQVGSALSIVSHTGTATFIIGGNHASTTHAGDITNGSGTLSLIKTGNGTLTLAGTSSHTGTTTVSSGTLRITGNFGPSPVTVNADATLDVSGAANLNSLTLQSAATLARPLGSTMGTLHVTGNVNLDGSLRVTPQPGVTSGRFTILTHGGTRSGTLSLTGLPPGTTAHLKYEPNAVTLFLDDSDEDGLADTWEMAHFNNLSHIPSGDDDGDGQTNATEFLAGTRPADGSSLFAASATPLAPNCLRLSWPSIPGKTYRIESAPSPAGPWTTALTVPAAASPATLTSQEIDTAPSSSAFFYRIALDP